MYRRRMNMFRFSLAFYSAPLAFEKCLQETMLVRVNLTCCEMAKINVGFLYIIR